MSSFDTKTRTETFAPLISCVIDNALLETMPDIHQPPLQLTDVTNFRLVDPLLHYSPNFVINWVQSWAAGCQRSVEMNAAVSHYVPPLR